jgi:hypothetical protein
MTLQRRRRLVFFSAAIAALAAVLALVLPLTPPSASAAPAAGTRVGAHHPATILLAGLPQPVSAGNGRCEAAMQAQFASGACVAPEDGLNLYRGMRGSADGSPELGPSASKLGARPDVDIPVDENGMVRPGTGGMSVNESPTGMPEFRRPPSFGGSGKNLNMYCINSCDLGPGLQYVQEAGGHGFLEPASNMSFAEYQQYLY